jgi:hypothetical protein
MPTDRPTALRPLLKNRLRALLAAQERSFSALAAAGRVTPRHLELVLAGHRPLSVRLAEALRRELGDAGWAFATGQSATLDVSAAGSEA